MSIVSFGRAAGLIGALGLTSLLSATSASAQVSSAAVNAINAKRNSVPRNVATAYFQTPVTRTPLEGDIGGGAYQTFRGTSGPGAIYWSPSTNAHVIYGDILTYFTNNGLEAKLGYPSTDPLSGSGQSYGCASDTTVYQTFSRTTTPVSGRATPRTMYTLCANSRGRVMMGTVTLSGATAPRVGDVTRTGDEDLTEDDGYEDDYEDEDEDAWPADDRWGARADDEEEEEPAPPSRSPSSDRARGSSADRTPDRTPTGSRSSGSGILTPR